MSLERRTPLKRTALKRKRKASTTDRELALDWFREVLDPRGEHQGRCVMCGKGRRDARIQAHHTIRQQVIRATFAHGAMWSDEYRAWVPALWEDDVVRRHEEIRWDPSNGVPLCKGCHDEHTERRRLVPFEALGDGPRYFAVAHRDRNGITFEVELELQHPRGLESLRRPARPTGCYPREALHGRVS